jgi:hypothetical protein
MSISTMVSKRTQLSRVAKITTALLFFTWLIDYFDRLIMTVALPHVGRLSRSDGGTATPRSR